MQDKLIRYLLDPSGRNPDNLVRDEKHILSKNKIRAIAPVNGAFFSDSVYIVDSISKRPLSYGEDFCSGGLLQNESLLYGKSISSVILILNPEISNNITIKYQTLGADYQKNNAGLATLLNLSKPINNNGLFHSIEGLPGDFKPTFHKHDFGDVYGLDYLVYLLEKIRLAVIWKKVDMVMTIVKYADEYLTQLSADIIANADDTFQTLLINFKAAFNKVTYGLSLIKNYELITIDEAKAIFNDEHFDKTLEGYLSLTGLGALRNELYSYAVSTKATRLGLSHGTYILPNLTALSECVVGAVFLLNSVNINQLDGVTVNDTIYPDITKRSTLWSIKKLSGRVTDVGGIFMSTALSNGSTYIGRLKVNSLNELFMDWKPLLSTLDLSFIDVLSDHIGDKTNPHKDHKSRVKLGNVENLPVATREEIVCNIPARSYIVFSDLMLYMKRFMTGEKSSRDIDLQESEINTQRRMQAIFSPCGVCDTKKDEWNLVSECMVMEAPKKSPSVSYEADRDLVTNENEFATLTSYLEDFAPREEVTINIYRRVVDYQVPTLPPVTVPPPPTAAKYHYVTWTACIGDLNTCLDANYELKVGDSRQLTIPLAALRTGVIKNDLDVIVHDDVSWTMEIEDFTYISQSARQIVRKLVETNSDYVINESILKAQPGVLDDFAVKGLYKTTENFTAYRKLKFTGWIGTKEIGVLEYVQEVKVDVN